MKISEEWEFKCRGRQVWDECSKCGELWSYVILVPSRGLKLCDKCTDSKPTREKRNLKVEEYIFYRKKVL